MLYKFDNRGGLVKIELEKFCHLEYNIKTMGKKNLPIDRPISDGLQIAPESLVIANAYLELGDIGEVADAVGTTKDMVVAVLAKREVKNYVDTVFLNAGWFSRSKIAQALDRIIEKKLQELEEAEIGSSKDIAELLALAHKMRMDELNAIAKAEGAGSAGIRKQVNVQINDGVGGKNYNDLLQRLTANESNPK